MCVLCTVRSPPVTRWDVDLVERSHLPQSISCAWYDCSKRKSDGLSSRRYVIETNASSWPSAVRPSRIRCELRRWVSVELRIEPFCCSKSMSVTGVLSTRPVWCAFVLEVAISLSYIFEWTIVLAMTELYCTHSNTQKKNSAFIKQLFPIIWEWESLQSCNEKSGWLDVVYLFCFISETKFGNLWLFLWFMLWVKLLYM